MYRVICVNFQMAQYSAIDMELDYYLKYMEV